MMNNGLMSLIQIKIKTYKMNNKFYITNPLVKRSSLNIIHTKGSSLKSLIPQFIKYENGIRLIILVSLTSQYLSGMQWQTLYYILITSGHFKYPGLLKIIVSYVLM